MKLKILFAWYDLWMGIFIDRIKGTVYVLPIPTVGIKIELIPEGYKIEQVMTHWTKQKPERAYIAYKIYSDEDSQIGTYHTWVQALWSIYNLKRVLKQSETYDI